MIIIILKIQTINCNKLKYKDQNIICLNKLKFKGIKVSHVLRTKRVILSLFLFFFLFCVCGHHRCSSMKIGTSTGALLKEGHIGTHARFQNQAWNHRAVAESDTRVRRIPPRGRAFHDGPRRRRTPSHQTSHPPRLHRIKCGARHPVRGVRLLLAPGPPRHQRWTAQFQFPP